MNSKTIYLIKVQAILFVVFLISCFFFNRFAVDDYYFIGEINNKSFSEIYSHLHLKWHGRWTSNFLLLFFIQFHKVPFFLFGFNLLSSLLMYLSIFRLFKSINNYFNLELYKSNLIIYSIIFLSIFFFCTVNPNETWFWFTSSVVYFWSIIALLFSSNLFLKKQLYWYDYFLYFIGLIYIGGSNEPLTVFIFLSFVLLIVKNYKRKIVLLGLVTITCSFLINYLSKGTIHREEITPGLSLLSLLLYSGYNTIKYLFVEFHFTYQIAIILSIPFYILGKHSKYSNPHFNPTREVIMNIILIGLVAYLNQFIVIFALGSLAPDRAIISSSFFTSVLMVRLFFLLGNYSKSTKKVIYYVPVWGCVYLLLLSIYFINIHRKYSQAVDKRIAKIKSSKQAVIVLDPLPKSGYLYNTEITTDSRSFKNQHLKYGLGIESDLVLKTN